MIWIVVAAGAVLLVWGAWRWLVWLDYERRYPLAEEPDKAAAFRRRLRAAERARVRQLREEAERTHRQHVAQAVAAKRRHEAL